LTNYRDVTQADLIVAQVSRKHRNLYYLLPGQGRGARKRFLRNLIVALIVGGITCGLLAWVFYLLE
jgi:hypothetical protein